MCTRACMCVRTRVRACHYEKKFVVVVLVVSSRMLCCSCPSRPCCGKGFFLVVISECFTEVFTASYTFFLLLCGQVGGSRKTANRLYEQTWATLRKKQRSMDGRVKKQKRQHKQILSLSLSLSLSLFLSFFFHVFLSMLISSYFFIGIDLLYL